MQLNIKTPDTLEEITALRSLFEEQLKYLYWSERTLSTVFGDLITYFNSHDIVRILLAHTANKQIHADRIEKIFDSIGIAPEEKKFEAINSFITEIDLVAEQIRSGSVRDAAIIALVQHIIHCEIASYGTLKSFAITLKEEEVVTLLDRSLEDEKNLDHQLSIIAEAYINDEAANKEF